MNLKTMSEIRYHAGANKLKDLLIRVIVISVFEKVYLH